MNINVLTNRFKNKTHLNIGLISDTHFAVHRRNNIFFPHMKKTVDYFLELCHDYKVDLIIHTGDVFDTKNIVATEGLINTNDLIQKISSKYPIILIPGNHDYAFSENQTFNLPSNYKNYDNICVIDYYEQMVLKNADLAFHFLTFQHNPKEHLKNVNKANNVSQNILFAHIGILGFKMHEYASVWANKKSAQIKQEKLKKFNKVFCGHYHGYQSKNEITYVSAPLQSRHGDEHSKHGFVFWNTKNKSHVFIKNKYTPKFKTFILTKPNVKKMLKLKNHYIRIKVRKKISSELILLLKRKLKKNNYDVKFDFDITSNIKLAVIQGWQDFVIKDPDSLIISYLNLLEEQNELPYSKNDLLKII